MPQNSCIMQIWAESGKSALPICNYSQILYQFLAFTQNLKRSQENIYPLVQTVNAFYLQLLEMQKAFTSPDRTPDTLPSSEAIKELQIEYTNMLTAIIDLLDGAKYLWERDCHEQQS